MYPSAWRICAGSSWEEWGELPPAELAAEPAEPAAAAVDRIAAVEAAVRGTDSGEAVDDTATSRPTVPGQDAMAEEGVRQMSSASRSPAVAGRGTEAAAREEEERKRYSWSREAQGPDWEGCACTEIAPRIGMEAASRRSSMERYHFDRLLRSMRQIRRSERGRQQTTPGAE